MVCSIDMGTFSLIIEDIKSLTIEYLQDDQNIIQKYAMFIFQSKLVKKKQKSLNCDTGEVRK